MWATISLFTSCFLCFAW